MAEIKSDRELPYDPMLMCLPGYLRWTIHAKRGQLAVSTPIVLGKAIQAWAGTAVFKMTKKGKVRLATLPVLVLEGNGAIPVRIVDQQDDLYRGDQPIFYIYPDLEFSDVGDLLSKIENLLTRMRVS
jgi:hypothetical protein